MSDDLPRVVSQGRNNKPEAPGGQAVSGAPRRPHRRRPNGPAIAVRERRRQFPARRAAGRLTTGLNP